MYDKLLLITLLNWHCTQFIIRINVQHTHYIEKKTTPQCSGIFLKVLFVKNIHHCHIKKELAVFITRTRYWEINTFSNQFLS